MPAVLTTLKTMVRNFEASGPRAPFAIRGHSERDEKSPVSLNYGLNVRVSFFSVFRCFEARQGATLGISYATIQVGLTREAGNRRINENRPIFVAYPIISVRQLRPSSGFDKRFPRRQL